VIGFAHRPPAKRHSILYSVDRDSGMRLIFDTRGRDKNVERLETAMARLWQALEALEEAADARLRSARETVSTAAEVELLQAERARLSARVAILEEESRHLAGLTEEVEDRLDGAIAEIREVLGRN
jgi:Domain of unknown function (DUF4164)